MRRFTESWYKWVPGKNLYSVLKLNADYVVIGGYYGIMMWADEYEHHDARKNPADFANDE